MVDTNDGKVQQRSPNLYAQLMRATARDDPATLKELISQARDDGILDDNLLRLGVQNCAKKGHEATARVLLENGAKTDITPDGKGGSPALFWAVSQPQNKGHQAVAKLLLSPKGQLPGCPADKNWRDDHGRSLVQSAAWRNHLEALQLLLDAGADINARDNDKQTVLHSLAADKKGKWDCEARHKIISLLLARPVDVNLRDDRWRTALHWACATGKTEMVDQLLTRPRYDRPDLNIRTDRGKTALNLACSTPPIPAIVEKLLKAGADAQITSDGGWSCLHVSAVIQNSTEIVELLLSYCPALINAKTSTGLTALHCAAEAGSQNVVRHLLSKPAIRLNAKDAFYTTPLLRAAQQAHIAAQKANYDSQQAQVASQKGSVKAYQAHLAAEQESLDAQKSHLATVDLLAPFNNVDRLSPYAADACNGFEATVVDFRGVGSDHQNIVQKRSVYEVLYAKEKDGEHTVTTRVDKLKSRARQGGNTNERGSKPRFRWIHLPANNLAWVEALIAKAFIEDDCSDLDGFKAVERSFSHQHRGPKFHSQFMTPLCQRAERGGASNKLPMFGPYEDAIQTSSGRSGHEYQSSPERKSRPQFKRPHGSRTRGSESSEELPKPWEHRPVAVPSVLGQMSATGNLRALTEEPETLPSAESVNEEVVLSRPKSPKPASMPTKESRKKRRKPTLPTQPGTDEERPDITPSATPRNPATRVNSMAEANTPAPAAISTRPKLGENLIGSNIMMFMPYLHWETDDRRRKMREAIANAQLELENRSTRRSLCHDETLIRAHLESSLHLRRTLDQFYLHGIDTEDRDADQVVYRYCLDNDKVAKLYMVDQLWLWILGPGLIITAFPQRWQQPKNDPLNVLDGIIEDVNEKTGKIVQSVYDLALLITARVCGSFDRHRPGDEDYQFLDMFESSIGSVNNQETALWRDFYAASQTVHQWVSTHQQPSSEADYPQVVDRFLDIGRETALLQEIKDIREELNMIAMVLNHQYKTTLPSLSDAICEDLRKAQQRGHDAKGREVRRTVDDQKRTVDMHLNELERMGKLSQGIEGSLLNLLDLKQKQSNAFEARFARDQAAGTVRQGQIIMVFTMVTIIFLPMSFLAAFFTIPILELPHNDSSGQPQLPLSYVSKFIFPIGLGVSVILIAIAFSINPLTAISHRFGLLARRQQRNDMSLPVYPYGSMSKQANFSRVGRFSTESTRKSLEVQEMEVLSEARRRSRSISLIRRPGHRRDIERG